MNVQEQLAAILAAMNQPAGNPVEVRRAQMQQRSMTLSTLASMKGCCALFDLCTDDNLMGLSFPGADPFLDWIGWQPSNECNIRKGFITYIRPQQSGGVCTDGYLANPCADPNGVDFGKCEFLLHDFARLRRQGPERDITTNMLQNCANEPRWRFDGTLITDEIEFDMRLATEVLLQDLRRMVVNGNATTAGQMDGLQRLVKNGYTDPDGQRCSSMDSIIIDWNANDLNGTGGTGVPTWNGTAQPAGYGIVDYLQAVHARFLQRISWAPTLAAQNLMLGDMVLVLPSSFIPCLLDAYTCWSVCPGKQYNEANLNIYEARNFRRTLDGGMFGWGRIWLNGQEIPLIAYDWGLINGPTRFDMYFLTGKAGSVPIIQGQYLDLAQAARSIPATFGATDGGRFLTWKNMENTCYKQIVEMRPRILMWAPFVQARFQDVKCEVLGGLLGPHPCDSSVFPETSFNSASCP